MDVASETDLQRLRQMALILEAENQTLHRRLRSLSDQVARLEGRDETAQLALELSRLQQTAALQRRALFGRKSERRGRPSADAAGTHVDATESAATERPRQTGHGPREQPELPVVEVFHDLDEPDRMCPQCGEQLVEWPGQFESSEEVDVVVREFRVVTHHRRKYRCSCGGCVETALGPPKLQAGGRYSPRFAVAVAIDKYADHLPLTRQGRRMARQGLQVGSQTLWDQLWALAEHLEPSWRALHARVLQSPVVGADETTWPMLESGSKKWWVWAATAPDAVYYEVQRRRNHEAAGKLLAGFSGVVVADGMGAYRKLQALRANAPPGGTVLRRCSSSRAAGRTCGGSSSRPRPLIQRLPRRST